MLKNNTGYDLKHLFIGAEGTLGVITRALLRLHPAARARATALVALGTYEDALALLSHLQSRFVVAAFELMWRDFVEAALLWQHMRDPFDQPYPLMAVVDVEGASEIELLEELEEVLCSFMEKGGVLNAALAQSQSQAAAFWRIREATTELPTHMRPPINFDVSLPMARIGDFATDCRDALEKRWPGHHSIYFGHIGDSNLHVTVDGISVGGDIPAVEQVIYNIVGQHAGSVSAEHGIGLHKKAYLSISRTKSEMMMMHAIKAALDPLGLMNPGKIFDCP